MKQNKLQEAFEVFELYMELYSKDPTAYINIGHLYYEWEQFEKAL